MMTAWLLAVPYWFYAALAASAAFLTRHWHLNARDASFKIISTTLWLLFIVLPVALVLLS